MITRGSAPIYKAVVVKYKTMVIRNHKQADILYDLQYGLYDFNKNLTFRKSVKLLGLLAECSGASVTCSSKHRMQHIL